MNVRNYSKPSYLSNSFKLFYPSGEAVTTFTSQPLELPIGLPLGGILFVRCQLHVPTDMPASTHPLRTYPLTIFCAYPMYQFLHRNIDELVRTVHSTFVQHA